MRCLLCGFWTVYVYLYPLLRLALAITHKKKRLYATTNVRGHHICYDISLTHIHNAPYTDTSVSCEVRGVSCEARLCDQASRRTRRGPRCAVAACACSLHLARGCAGVPVRVLTAVWTVVVAPPRPLATSPGVLYTLPTHSHGRGHARAQRTRTAAAGGAGPLAERGRGAPRPRKSRNSQPSARGGLFYARPRGLARVRLPGALIRRLDRAAGLPLPRRGRREAGASTRGEQVGELRDEARKDDEPGEGEEEEHGEPAAAVAVRDRVVAKPDGAERDKRIVEAGEEVPALRRGKDASAEQPVGEREADVEEGAPPRAGLVDAKQADEQRNARLRGEER
mmetsp:Transcript_4025/g.11999  ORF Transcript_4025/g.11999 Transcript_4025/m.11999 type:complete len:338 (-) Transcript_4025:590-1603(-)